jgi:hypothetical protein
MVKSTRRVLGEGFSQLTMMVGMVRANCLAAFNFSVVVLNLWQQWLALRFSTFRSERVSFSSSSSGYVNGNRTF